MTSLFAQSSAVLSDCGRYRYRLERTMSGRRTMVVCMLNPSTADASVDDPTIRKLLGFSSRLDVGRLIVVNLAALRSTNPKGLAVADDPIGPDNDRHITDAFCGADLAVVAWGAGVGMLRPVGPSRVSKVLDLIGLANREPMCWGRTGDGHPRHPLMLAYSTPLESFA